MMKKFYLCCVFFICQHYYSQNFLWKKEFYIGESILWHTKPTGCATDKTGNVYIAGSYNFPYTTNYSSSDATGYFIRKYDSSGKVLWSDTSGGAFEAWCGGVIADVNNNVYVAASSNGDNFRVGNTYYQGSNLFLIKYNQQGNILWIKNWPNYVAARGMHIDEQQNIYVTGGTFTAKYDTSGNELMYTGYGSMDVSIDKWDYIYLNGGKLDQQGNLLWNIPSGARHTADENGNTYYSNQGSPFYISYLTKRDLLGQPVWSFTVPYAGAFPLSIHQNYLYACGVPCNQNTSIGWGFYKYDLAGNLLWSHVIPKDTTETYAYHFKPGRASFHNNSIYVCGFKDKQSKEAVLVKYIDSSLAITDIKNNYAKNASVNIYPNPAKDHFWINYNSNNIIKEMRIVDVQGKLIYKKQYSGHAKAISEPVEINLNNGVYFVEIVTDKYKVRKKLLVE